MSEQPLRIERYDILPSTNEQARLDWESDVDLIVAHAQTDGRGTRGRSFHSPRGVGLYLSYLLRRELSEERLLRLTPLVAVAVRRALEEHGVSAGIKWVNDLYLNGKKLCGILVSPRFEGEKCVGAIIGIGINLGAQIFPIELRGIATSIENELGFCPDREHLLLSIAHRLSSLHNTDADDAAMREYRDASILIGQKVLVHTPNTLYSATVLDLDREGRLIVRDAQGGVLSLQAGEVSLISRLD